MTHRVRLESFKRAFLTVAMLRWWIVGVVFVAVNMLLLYLFVDVLRWAVVVATVIAAETGTLLRFLANDRWVFGKRRPTWRRLWQYHVANAASMSVWWVATNTFAFLGVHYLLASILAMGCSILLSMVTNFLWVWRRGPHAQRHERSAN